MVVDNWIIKTRRSSIKDNKVGKIFIKSNYWNLNRYNSEWSNLWKNKFLASKFEEYLFANGISEETLYVAYKLIFEKLKAKQYDEILKNLISNIFYLFPNFVELYGLWGDFLYESNRIEEAKIFYLKALKAAENRNIYDRMPIIPKMHKSHPEKMLANIDNLIKKYDQVH